MKLVSMIIVGSVLVTVMVVGVTGTEVARAIWLGMIAPVVVTSIEWVAAERRYRSSPNRLNSLIFVAFFGKMVVFGAYVAVVLGLSLASPVPFIVTFVVFFLALLTIEAIALHRLTSIDSTSRGLGKTT